MYDSIIQEVLRCDERMPDVFELAEGVGKENRVSHASATEAEWEGYEVLAEKKPLLKWASCYVNNMGWLILQAIEKCRGPVCMQQVVCD